MSRRDCLSGSRRVTSRKERARERPSTGRRRVRLHQKQLSEERDKCPCFQEMKHVSHKRTPEIALEKNSEERSPISPNTDKLRSKF